MPHASHHSDVDNHELKCSKALPVLNFKKYISIRSIMYAPRYDDDDDPTKTLKDFKRQLRSQVQEYQKTQPVQRWTTSPLSLLLVYKTYFTEIL